MEDALPCFARASELDPLNLGYAGGQANTLLGLRRYPEAVQQIELLSRRFPKEGDAYFFRAWILVRIHGDCTPLRAALRDYGKLVDAESRSLAEAEIAQCEGRFGDSAAILASLPNPRDPVHRKYRIACLWHLAGKTELSQEILRQLVAEETALRRGEKPQSFSMDRLCRLAVAQSLLGEHDAAIATVNEAQALAPESVDLTNGPRISAWRAAVLVLSGRREEGDAEAKRLLHVPYASPVDDMSPPDPLFEIVKADPVLDGLFNHPPRL
jgi:tetratricopeptide (TPR) repeat protein